MHPSIAIQGDRASFHDIAAKKFFGPDSTRVFCDTFEDAFRSLYDKSQDKKADYALCAIENSLYGSINTVYDLLLQYHCFIFGEVYLRIEQCLIGLPGASIGQITTVHSHPVALGQCAQYLDQNLPEADRLEYHDTAAAVELVKELNNPAVAAIAGREAAALYGMEILAESIETNKENYTRFVCLRTQPEIISTQNPLPHSSRPDVISGQTPNSSDKDLPTQTKGPAGNNLPYSPTSAHSGPNKTSLVITTGHTPGSLYRALGCLAEQDINISKIQSRPIVGKAWSYMFYLDVHAGIQEDRLKTALKGLAEEGRTVKVLGSYVNALNA